MELEDLKRRLAKVRGSGQRRYPTELREAVVRYAGSRRAARASRTTIASELGMSVGTLEYWCGPARSKATLAPVAIVHAEPNSELIVELGALRVRGLDVTTLAALLRRLAREP